MTTQGSSPRITGGFADHQNFLAFSPGKVPNGCRLAEEEPHTTISRAPVHVYPEDGAKEHEYQGDPTSCCMVNSSTPTRTTFWMITETPTSTRMFRSTLWYLR